MDTKTLNSDDEMISNYQVILSIISTSCLADVSAQGINYIVIPVYSGHIGTQKISCSGSCIHILLQRDHN